MSYLEMLKMRKAQNHPNQEATKAGESLGSGSFVGFGSGHLSAFSKNIRTPRLEESKKCAESPLTRLTKANTASGSEKTEETLRSQLTKPTKVFATVDCELRSISEFEERASILEHDGGLDRDAANRAAAKELGFARPDALFMAHITAWRVAIEAIGPRAAADTDADRLAARSLLALREASLAFLNGDLALEAVRFGWDEVQLFGCHEGPALMQRGDAFGLVPLLVWGTLGLELKAVNPEGAFLKSPSGSTLRHPRFRANHNEAVPFWRHPRFQAGTEGGIEAPFLR